MRPASDAAGDRIAELEVAVERWATQVDELEAERDRLLESLRQIVALSENEPETNELHGCYKIAMQALSQ